MPAAPRKNRFAWETLSDAKLLDLRLCDLGLKIPGSPLQARVDQLYGELAARGLRFRPPCWLSDEWFCPDETPGIAIPFYLAHPRLMKLEDRMMLEVEGGSRTWCMQLLRHEAGHAYELAHRLGRRRRWLQVFGRAGKPYPEFYNPKEWPVLKKLEYVDELMAEIGRQPAKLRTRRRIDPVSGLKSTLREYYRDKQERYGEDYPDYFDRDLRRLFVEPTTGSRLPRAATMLRRFAPELRNVVASWTGEYTYTVNMPLKDIIARCRELDLRVDRPVERVKLETAVMLTMQTTNFLHSSVHRLAM
jgi:hypothetical protein